MLAHQAGILWVQVVDQVSEGVGEIELGWHAPTIVTSKRIADSFSSRCLNLSGGSDAAAWTRASCEACLVEVLRWLQHVDSDGHS